VTGMLATGTNMLVTDGLTTQEVAVTVV